MVSHPETGSDSPIGSDRDRGVTWRSSTQEGKTFYTEQATRGPRVCEFLTTPRGRIFSLLDFYSHF